jgi:hypothetical protein
MAKNGSSSNSQRSNTKNPNNPAYVADRGNRIQQGDRNPPPPPPVAPPGTLSPGTPTKS